MKTNLKQMALLVIGLLLGPQVIYAQESASNSEVQVQESDLNLIAQAQFLNIFEIDAAKIALEKSEESSIREYAQLIIQEREKLAEQWNILIAQKNWQLPEVDGQVYKSQLEALRALESSALDAQYLQLSLNNHKNTISEFEKLVANESVDTDLKKILSNQIKQMQTNIDWINAYESSSSLEK